MLKISIPPSELWNESKHEFINKKGSELVLEHSLVSISKWESKWAKAFLSKKGKTFEEEIDYIKCMTMTQNVDQSIYNHIPKTILMQIHDYISKPMTATYFPDDNSKSGNAETITSELIYYWIIAFNIPIKCEKWHLNRLLALIKVCELKNRPQKKINAKELISRNAKLNAERRAKMNSKG